MNLRHQETINQFYKWREMALARKQERLNKYIEASLYGVDTTDSIAIDPDSDCGELEIESGE